MKRVILTAFWVVLFCLPCLGAAPEGRKPLDRGALVPAALRCEYIEGPSGIDEPGPRLGWKAEPGRWSVGLLEDSDWRAEWIGHKDDAPVHESRTELYLPPPRAYRKEFQAKKQIRRATVPANATATVYLPAKEGDNITESGINLINAPGVKLLKYDGDRAVLSAASGDYRFVVEASPQRSSLATERTAAETGKKPLNVMFIAVDDLNDWIGCLGGHPQADTPNLDRLADRGVLFTNAHCQAPICNPSRISLLTGLMPSSTGVYYLAPRIREWEATKESVTVIQHFGRNGYDTIGAGKIFHASGKGEFGEYGGSFGAFGPRPKEPISCGLTHPLWDWGAYPEKTEDMPDAKIAKWTVGKIHQDREKPFFMGIGFYRPHVPMYAPQKWFDRHPLDGIRLPAHRDDDLNDVPQYGQDLTWGAVAPRHKWLVENNEWEHAVQSYLACVTFVDAQVGKVLDALDAAGQTDNTVVVLWGDHGFQLGTKERWGKRALWETATKVPLMISAPGFERGVKCDRPVGLIDLYPTLVELCGLDPVSGLEGHSLVPLLKDHRAERPWPAVTTFGQNNHAIRSQNWRYIVYADGSEELYNCRRDPNEFTNLAKNPKYGYIIEQHRRWLPQNNQPMAPGSAHADARPGSAPDIDGEPKFPK